MTTPRPRDRRRRRSLVLAAAGATAAVILVLGISGTLSSWTSAIITNDDNTVEAAQSLVLQETGPGNVVCTSTDGGGSGNSATCSTIDKYGGTAVPLGPGDHQTVTVSLENTGTGSGALTLAPGSCVTSAGSPSASADLCDVATVTVACTTPSTVDTTATPVALSALAQLSVVTTLAAGESTDCTFDVALPASASPQVGGQVATQPLVWTLS
ncbi:hypothetical protein ACFFOS_22215 [Nocardioides kongjuensis]|uniref:DUF11 domain-containing protein n=1 Tax=Nocardioides kongjuensis TaxID=349522 RepID=A0A852RNB5_9ACTN|nr:hypothetical protein [Nocardioides kongjuensis]NYD29524.1 hypothetical protein [Nocardioides kongjuensis]